MTNNHVKVESCYTCIAPKAYFGEIPSNMATYVHFLHRTTKSSMVQALWTSKGLDLEFSTQWDTVLN